MDTGYRWASGKTRLVMALLLALAVGATLLSGCAPSVQAAVGQNKAKLDAEIHNAELTVGVPATLLTSIASQEDTLAAGVADGTDASGQAAATGYARLYDQVVALEQLTPSQIRERATLDLQALALALQQVAGQGFTEVPTFQANYQQAQQQLGAAQSTKELFAADGYVLDQAGAVSQIIPVYHEMQALDALVGAQATALGSTAAPLQCAIEYTGEFWASDADLLSSYGLDPSAAPLVGNSTKFTFSAWSSQNLAAFRAASSSADFAELSATVLAEMSQLTADSSALLPQQTAAAVNAFQADVQTYQTDGGKDTTYTREATQDAQALAATKTLADVTALAKTVAKHRQDFALPFIKVKAQADMQALTTLVEQANAKKTIDSLDGGYNVAYPDGIEYIGKEFDAGNFDWTDETAVKSLTDTVGATGDVYAAGSGIGDARYRLRLAQTLDDYQAVESEIQMFTTNVQAMLTDLAQMPTDNNARKAWSMTAHQSDLDLLNYYGLQNTRVIVVSLREQKARLYENGKLATYTVTANNASAKLIPDPQGRVDAFDVTTGGPDLPSVPGAHCVIPYKQHDYEDKSTLPKNSPFYYNPTPIHFGFGYNDGGYFMHDAWWRDATQMGYLTNLPHYDPEAFNGGSHGCINFHYVDYATGRYDMSIVYQFAQEGTPIIVY
ncbi:MAG TPA: L,D-transpeptidase [Chloroflexota bacterium]